MPRRPLHSPSLSPGPLDTESPDFCGFQEGCQDRGDAGSGQPLTAPYSAGEASGPQGRACPVSRLSGRPWRLPGTSRISRRPLCQRRDYSYTEIWCPT